jgi:hypothetical protein
MECGAKRKNGELCKSPAMPSGKCRIHGGKSLSGIASPSLVHGRYSKHLPTRILASFSESVADPDILVQVPGIALLDARLNDVLESASNGESGELWKRLKEGLRVYDKHAQSLAKDAEFQKAEALANLRWLINEGYAEWQTWMEIRHVLDDRRKLVDSEMKRVVSAQQMITATDAYVMMGMVADVINRYVTDRPTLTSISAELVALAVGARRR